MRKIGFIGLGSMGAGMTRHLLEAGHPVAVYDNRPEAMGALACAGAEVAASPKEAAREAQLLAVCVFDAAQAEAVLFGADGAIETLVPGAVVTMHTTMSPAEVRALETRLAATGHGLIDAPVTGGKAGADAGTLTVIASGPEAAFALAEPVFETFGRRIYRIGAEVGAASTVKMVNQLLVGVHTVAAVEAITLAVKAGADPKQVYDVITHGGGNSVSFKTRIPYVFDEDYDPRGVIEIFIKDLGIVTGTAEDLQMDLPLTQAALTQYRAAVEAGLGQMDDAAMVKVYEARAGVDVAAKARESDAGKE